MQPSFKIDNKEHFLNLIIENIPLMVFVKDAKELRFVRFNKAAEELLGYSKDEMIGKNDYDFFPKDQADFFINKDKEVLNNKSRVDIPEEEIMTKHKGKRILHTIKVPILDENQNPIYLLGISEDITTSKESKEELEKLNEMMIGRELKMADLKNQIVKLQQQIDELQHNS